MQGICQRGEHKEVGRAAVCTAALAGDCPLQGLELRDQRGWSPVFNSVVFNDIPCFKQMVRVGATIDGVDKEGMRSCVLSTQSLAQQIAPLSLLLERGCTLRHLLNKRFSSRFIRI